MNSSISERASQPTASTGASTPGAVVLSPLVPHSTIDESIERFIFVTSLNARPATIVYYKRHLRPLLDLDKPIGAVTIEDLQWLYAQLHSRQTRFADHPTRPALPSGLSTYTLHKYVRAWKRFFNWLVLEAGVLIRNPAAKLKRPKLPRRAPKDMTLEDLERLLEASRGKSDRDYAILCFLADTACRVGGLATLLIGNLDLRGHGAVVREKGDEDRGVHFEDRTERALQRYLDGERRAQMDRLTELGTLVDGRVFLGRKGPLTTSGVYLLLKRLAKEAGVQGRYNPHSIRHAWARNAIKNHANLKEVQEFLGHKSINTTANSYVVYLDEELRERHRQLTLLPPEPGEENKSAA